MTDCEDGLEAIFPRLPRGWATGGDANAQHATRLTADTPSMSEHAEPTDGAAYDPREGGPYANGQTSRGAMTHIPQEKRDR